MSSVSIASPEVEAPGVRGERIGLVHEEDAVERAAHDPVCLERGHPHVLGDEPRAVDLDELTPAEEAHRVVHLGQQSSNRRLAGARVSEKDEMLARRHLGEAAFLPQRLHLQEGEQRTHLILDTFEADQAVQFALELLHRARGCARREVLELGDPELRADRSERLPSVFERIARHFA